MKRLIVFCIISIWGFHAMAQKKVLVFSKTAGFRHPSIKEGRDFFVRIGQSNGWKVDTTENAQVFTEENLKTYAAVVFLNTTGDILNNAQQADFERYIQAGGGYVGVHAASDCEYKWPWYNQLMGGFFASHPFGKNPNVQNGQMTVTDASHASTAHLPKTFERKDEFYDFKSFQKDLVKVLITVDEKSYKGGKMGDYHPMAWYHEFDGGRSWYTNFGHTPETFSEPDMQKHILEGLKYVMAEKLDYSKARSDRSPEENRFVRTTLAVNLDEPTELATLPTGHVLVVERKGAVKLYSPAKNEVKTIAKFDKLYTKFEYGLMGVGVDPNFAQNHFIYMYYTPDDDKFENHLARFVFDTENESLDLSKETTILKVNIKKNECCHTGGSIDWDSKGNLFLSTGDDTNPFASDGYAPLDFQEGREGWDGLRGPGNTNDLRGKILRITPKADGSYTIPAGNLFAEGTPNTRPEIFVMGCRNPYRIAVDKHTDWLYWGDIGPDAGKDDPNRGPQGYVEFNQARTAGNYGWPLFVANNKAYKHFDFATKTSGEAYNPAKPVNDSPHNTGLKELPPAQKPLIWYPYGVSKEFPWVGVGGCNPMAGPVYYSADYAQGAGKFPKYFDGKFFAYEWMRDWIYVVSLDANGNYAGAERFMPSEKFSHPMDMAFDSQGSLFVLDYGQSWFAQNEDATLSKIDFVAGNRSPVVNLSTSSKVGTSPLAVSFDASTSKDFDGDALKFAWDFGNGKAGKGPKVKHTYKKPGEYTVKLTVTDAAGKTSQKTSVIKVGNEEPSVAISSNANKTFFFDDEPLNYTVQVKDKEDGSLGKGINGADVMVSVDYLEGFDKTMLAQGHKSNTSFSIGKRLIELSDCASCHQEDDASIGPSYKSVSKKYERNSTNINLLAEKIIAGGGGTWGEQAMAAHPQISNADAKEMVDYILTLSTKPVSKPLSGEVSVADHQNKKAGAYIIAATYTDKGGKVIGPLSSSSILTLRSSKIIAATADQLKSISKYSVEPYGDLMLGTENGASLAFNGLDLTAIKSIEIGAVSMAGRTVGGLGEIRVGSPTGSKIGSFTVAESHSGPLKVPIEPANGIQDLYIVYINDKAAGKPLFAITDLKFVK